MTVQIIVEEWSGHIKEVHVFAMEELVKKYLEQEFGQEFESVQACVDFLTDHNDNAEGSKRTLYRWFENEVKTEGAV